jgi:hypothetical protein
VLIFLNILPYSKHFHIITAVANVFARNPRQNTLPTITDIEGKVEREEAIGFAKITDLSWKDVLDLYTCTECGRCRLPRLRTRASARCRCSITCSPSLPRGLARL